MRVLVLIALCAAAAMAASIPNKAEPVQTNFFCPICEGVIDELEKELNNEEGDIEKKIDTVCNKLGFFKEECIKLINTNIEDLIKKFEDKETPTVICKQFHLC